MLISDPAKVMMDPVDILEKRIAALEMQVLPAGENVIVNKMPITDLLIQTHTMISSALSCREIVASVLEKTPLINDLLNPLFTDSNIQIQAKYQYILELQNELKETAKMLQEFEKLTPIKDSKSILNINDSFDKLNSITVVNLSNYEKITEVNKKVLNLLQQYSDMMKSIRLLFVQLEKSLCDIEISSRPKASME